MEKKTCLTLQTYVAILKLCRENIKIGKAAMKLERLQYLSDLASLALEGHT